VYSTKIDGQVLEFGTSGLLYRSNKLMYDRSTETLWRQFTGEPVVGSLVDSGIKLEVLPVLLTTWGDWLATHPDTTVLDPDTGYYPADLYSPEWDPQSIYHSLRQQPVLNDTLGGHGLVVITPGDSAGSRAYQREGLQSSSISLGGRRAAEVFVMDQGGEKWRMEGEALVDVDDPTQRLGRLPGHVSYWFGWYAFHNETGVYGQN